MNNFGGNRIRPMRAYRKNEAPPSILERSSREVAETLLTLAQEREIALDENLTLEQILCQLPNNSILNSESYALLSEVLSFLYEVDSECL